MPTDLISLLGVAYCRLGFCAEDLVERAGDAVFCTGVMGRSWVEAALGRLVGGTANDPSSSVRGRFSATFALAGVGLALVFGVDTDAGMVFSPLRATILGTGFFLMTGGSVILDFTSIAVAFGVSLRSFFSALVRFGGRRRIWPTTCALGFENFSLTIILGSVV